MKITTVLILLTAITSRDCHRVPSTNFEECKEKIDLFNEVISRQVINDIDAVNSKLGYLPNDLIMTYQSAKDEWNKALKDLKNNFSKRWTGVTIPISADAGKEDWRTGNLADYERFFHLLTEYNNGVFSDIPERDLLGRSSWLTSVNIKKRLDESINRFLINHECANFDIIEIRREINPTFLPDNIKDCVN